jgi:hypothetical protein
MRQKVLLFSFCVALLGSATAQDANVAVPLSKFGTGNAITFTLAQSKPGESLFGNGKPNFSATSQSPLAKRVQETVRLYTGLIQRLQELKQHLQAPKKMATCYAMRSYNFDKSETPQAAGETTCTDSKLAQKKFAGAEAK